MWLQILFVFPLLLFTNGIKVPVDPAEQNSDSEVPVKDNPTQITPIYIASDEANDSYLLAPEQQKTEAELPEAVVTPATFLSPPNPGKQPEYYYNPTEPGEQTDWYPIAQVAPAGQLQPIVKNPNQEESKLISTPKEHTRRSKSYNSRNVPVPSLALEPPLENAPNDYFIPTSPAFPLEEIQRPVNVQKLIPLEEIQRPLNVPYPAKYELPVAIPKIELPLNYRPKLIEPALALHLIPPQPAKYKIPTKLYPKKFGGEFKPVPIPIAQYVDGSALEIPRAKPAKLFKPLPSTETDYLTPTNEKINYLYRKAEHKRKLKGEELSQVVPPEITLEDTYSKYNKPSVPKEQDASESNYRHPERNPYSAPLRQAPPAASQQHNSNSPPAPDERTEFRMHGMKGPHSYQFGFDTGKGKNRQFRYEERDNDGRVSGHYGYMDKHGKLRVVNYSADPKTGFHAEAPVDKE